MSEPRAYATGQYTLLAECREGLLMFNKNDSHVGRSLLKYGDYSVGECALFDRLLKPHHVVVEAGAHIGALTVVMARRAAKVYAFEPQHLPFQMLCANLALRECRNVWAYRAPVGIKNDVVWAPDIAPDSPHNSGGVILSREDGDELMDTYALDSLPVAFDFLKADVEGMELDVLRGGEKSIERNRPTLYLEALYNYPAIEEFLLARGYDIYWHFVHMFDPDNFRKQEENIFGESCSVNILCVPTESSVIADAQLEVRPNVEIIVDGNVLSNSGKLLV